MNVDPQHHSNTSQNDILKLFCNEQNPNSTSSEVVRVNNLIICPLCAKEPSYFKSYDSTLSIVPYVHFHCTSCQYQWMLCRLCCYNMQPKLPSKRDQDRNRKNIYQKLKNVMKQHTEDNHHEIIHQPIEQCDSENWVEYGTDENNTVAEDLLSTLSINNQNIELLTNLYQIFPDVRNDRKRKKHNAHIRNLIYMQKTKRSYTEDLILEKWLGLNPEQYSISKTDSDLFLRIVRQILLNSRGEQSKIVDIYSRIENRNNEETTSLRDHVKKLCHIIENQKLQIKSLCDTFGIENCDICSDTTIASAQHNVRESDNRIIINKLSLPLTAKDTRRITNSFVTGLACPIVQSHNVDGYAYVLPSDVLPIAITTGVKFEYYKKNGNGSNDFHERSIFHTRYIKNIIDRFTENEQNLDENNDDETTYTPKIFVPLGLWSDGCDTGSASKANRNLVKLTTLHFVNPQIKEEHVFPIGLGDHNGDHNYVRKIILDDLKKLTDNVQKYYVPIFEKPVFIQFFIAYMIQDRVEHCVQALGMIQIQYFFSKYMEFKQNTNLFLLGITFTVIFYF